MTDLTSIQTNTQIDAARFKQAGTGAAAKAVVCISHKLRTPWRPARSRVALARVPVNKAEHSVGNATRAKARDYVLARQLLLDARRLVRNGGVGL